jgi:hypothetical protein
VGIDLCAADRPRLEAEGAASGHELRSKGQR